MIDPSEFDDRKQRLLHWIAHELPRILTRSRLRASEDESQDVMLRLLTLVSEGKLPQSTEHCTRLAFTILRGIRANRARRARLEPRSSSTLRSTDDDRDPIDLHASPATEPINRKIAQEILAALRECVKTLPEQYRFTVESRYCEGLPYGEISVKANTSEDNCRARLKRGLKRVYDCLLEKGFETEDVFTVWQVRTDD